MTEVEVELRDAVTEEPWSRKQTVRRGQYADAGRRPFVILTRTAAISVLNAIVVAQLTSTVRGLPTEGC